MFKLAKLDSWRFKFRLGVQLFILSTLLCGSASASASIATKPVSRLTTVWWRHRFEMKQNELKRGQVALLWLGDSITQDWERTGPSPLEDFASVWQRFYGDRHAINLGFRGDSTCHLLWRLQHGELDGIRPKVAIVLIGANNFGRIHTNADQTYDGIQAIVELLHHALPETKVILIGVLPSIRSAWVNSNTSRLNHRLAALPAMQGAWLHYIDVSAALQTDGRTDPGRFLDPLLTPADPPLHPNAAAQADIARMIEPLVTSLMNDYKHQ